MHKTIRDVMTSSPKTLGPNASALEAARLMREADIGDVMVTENGRLCGILTDRDIVVRAIAEGRDPACTPIGDIASRELTTVSPEDSLGHAVRLMRERAIRRLPVDDKGTIVGLVSIGDLAVDADRHSALADISAAPPSV